MKAAKWMASILAVATVATCAFTVVSCSKDKTDEQTNVGIEQTMTNGGMQIGAGTSNGIKLMSATLLSSEYETYGVSATAESAYTLTATVTPSYTTNPVVNWSVSWVDPSSSWASGKTATDYVTVTPSGGYNHTAVVSCNKAFGEQIKITATAESNSAAYADCIVDYSQKINGGYLRVTSNPNSQGNFFICGLTSSEGEMLDTTYEYAGGTYILPTYTDYTLADTFTNTCTFEYSSEFISAVTAGTNSITSANYSFIQTSWDMTSEEMPYTVVKIVDSMSHPDPSTQNAYILSYNYSKTYIYDLLAANPDMVIGYIKVNCTGTYSTFSNTIAVKASDEVTVQEATAVAVDETSVVF